MPASRVLLVDHDVDSLARLAAQLRERGIRVSLANGAQMACERAKAGAFDVVLAAREVAEPEGGGMGVIDALSVELSQVPPLVVLVDADGESNGESRVSKNDIEKIVSRIGDLARPSERPEGSSLAPSAHALENGSVGDLLVVLGTEKRSGTITLTTPRGSGELRLVDGDVVDAVYMRLEGSKAITRMISERDGNATFTPGAPAIMRRMTENTRMLVAVARSEAAHTLELREKAGELAKTTLIAMDGVSGDGVDVVQADVLARLRMPAMLDEVLDELPHSDASILEAVIALDARRRIKKLGHASSRVQLCGPDQLHLLRAAASRARIAGFSGPARIVFAATPSRLAVFGHTVLSLADAFPASDPTPSVPVPYILSTIRLGDGVSLDIVALPLVPAYAPLWPMALAGASVVVRLDEAAAGPLAEACTSVALPVLDARGIFGTLDESSAVQIASLIKTALDADAGS